MSTTWIGLIVIIATITLILKKQSLVPLAIAVAPLQGASVININYFIIGISPYYFVLVFISFEAFLRFLDVLKKHRRKKYFFNSHIVKKYFLFLNIFLVWAGFSLLFPFIFEGMKVYVPRKGILDELGSLTFSMSNIAQFIYLTLNIVFIKEMYRYSLSYGADLFIKLTLFCGSFVVFIGLWDFSNLGFPRNFFLNNITSTLDSVKDYQIVDRVAATFSEPSVASAFFVPFLMMIFVSLLTLKENFAINIFLTVITCVLVFATFSTTAYLSTFLSLNLLFLCIIIERLNHKNKLAQKNILHPKKNIRMVFLLLFVCLLLIFVISNIDNATILLTALNDVVFKKNDNLSAIYRNDSNTYAYKLLIDTFGLGVGIGGNRPSSFTAYLASNFGVVGILFYILNIVLILVFLFKKLIIETSLKSQKIFLLWSANFIAMSLAIPDLNWPYLWIYTGFILSSINPENSTSPKSNDSDTFDPYKLQTRT